jgi:type I restriction enzyme S subunit
VIVHIEPEQLKRVLVPTPSTMQLRTIGYEMCRATELRDEANDLLDQADTRLREALGLPEVNALTTSPRTRPRVRLSELNDRIDGAFYDPAARALEVLLTKAPRKAVPLGTANVATVRAVTKFRKRTYVTERGLPLLPSKQLFQFDPINVKGLARGAHLKDLPEISLAEGMIVVASSGTVSVGRVQIVPRYMGEWAASQDALRVVAADVMNPGYLYAWLASDHGQLLIRRQMYGSVILHIDREQLGSVLVPILAQDQMREIGDLVLEANRRRDEAWDRERDAINAIERMVGLL